MCDNSYTCSLWLETAGPLEERLRAGNGWSSGGEIQSSAVWKSRWPSWASVPNKPTVFVDVKQHFSEERLRAGNGWSSGGEIEVWKWLVLWRRDWGLEMAGPLKERLRAGNGWSSEGEIEGCKCLVLWRRDWGLKIAGPLEERLRAENR